MHDLIRKAGFPYAFDPAACAGCGGRCCTGESGNIYLDKAEITAMAAHLELSEAAFVGGYMEKRGYRLALREIRRGDSHDCIFYENGCRVYAVRPAQCRSFPFWEYYQTRVTELKEECPGILDE